MNGRVRPDSMWRTVLYIGLGPGHEAFHGNTGGEQVSQSLQSPARLGARQFLAAYRRQPSPRLYRRLALRRGDDGPGGGASTRTIRAGTTSRISSMRTVAATCRRNRVSICLLHRATWCWRRPTGSSACPPRRRMRCSTSCSRSTLATRSKPRAIRWHDGAWTSSRRASG